MDTSGISSQKDEYIKNHVKKHIFHITYNYSNYYLKKQNK